MKATNYLFLVALASSILVTSCSNDLSRAKAEKLIIQKNNLPQTQTTTVAKRYLIKSWGDGWKLCGFSGQWYSNAKKRLDDLQSKGLITQNESQEHNGGCHYNWVVVGLTNEGKNFLIKETYGDYEVKSHEIAFGEITGIQLPEQHDVAIAEYTLINTNPTPFCGKISSDPIKKKDFFSKYDDGWRIE